MGESLVGTNNCYGYGKGGYMVKQISNVRSQGKGDDQPQLSVSSSEAQERNCFYALKARGKEGNSPNVVTGMLQVFSDNVYAMLDPGDTLSFITPLVSNKINVLPDVLMEPFTIRIPRGQIIYFLKSC